MKKLLVLTMIVALFGTITAKAQGKAQRPSPPDTVKAVTSAGVDISVAYSQPAVKGRTIGKEIAPWGQIWRTGANEETALTVSKDVKVNGNALPAGKYSIWTIPGEKEWTIIINSNTKNWGTQHDAAADLFKFTVKTEKSAAFTERLKFAIDKSGKVSFSWGDYMVAFNVK